MIEQESYQQASAIKARAQQEDPWVMYFVVRKNLPLSLASAMAAAGGVAVRCDDIYAENEQWRDAFAAWREQSFRKVALRASASEMDRLQTELDAVPACTPDILDGLLCLPPRRKSERTPLLKKLQAFTEAPIAKEPHRAQAPSLLYVVRANVMKSMGKAMAQAGHASLMSRQMHSKSGEWEQWERVDMPGELLLATEKEWTRIKQEVECVVVQDAGLTQVASGTETVIAIAPAHEHHPLLNSLPRLA